MSNTPTASQIKADEKAAWEFYDQEMNALDAYAKVTDEVGEADEVFAQMIPASLSDLNWSEEEIAQFDQQPSLFAD